MNVKDGRYRAALTRRVGADTTRRSTRRELLIALATGALGVPFVSFAQQPARVPRIGYLSAGSSKPEPRLDAFRQGLRELGYVESQNIVIEYRFAEGKYDRLPQLAAELVRLKVDVIVLGTSAAVPAVKQAATTILIVMGISYDPVASGLVASLVHTGPMLGFKTFANAAKTIAGIELIHRIRKGQFRLIRKRGPTPLLPMRVAWNLALA